MGLRFDPMGGGQFQQAIKQIVEAERQPIHQLEGRKAQEEARLKNFQEFKGKFSGIDKALSEFSTFRKFRELKADLGDGNSLATVTIDKDRAQPGSYEITVDQLAERSSILTNGFENPDDPVLGVGYVTAILPNGESYDLYVDEDKGSLRGVAELINRDNKFPVRASVIKDNSDPDKPWRMILSGKGDGTDDAVYFPEFYFMDGDEDLYIDDDHSAQNAVVRVDGFPIEAPGNDLNDFFQGVNLHLKSARPDQPFTLTITQDYQKVSGKVKELVDSINGILGYINSQNAVDDKTDTRTMFTGDSGLSGVQYRLRNLVHNDFPIGTPGTEGYRTMTLSQLGIQFEKDGLLSFKQDKFNKVVEADFDGVAEALTGPSGFAAQFRQVIGTYTRPVDGTLAIREQGMRNSIKRIDDDIAQKERRVEQKQEALVRQYSHLESTLANMQRQQAYMASQLGGGGGGNMLAQLMGQGG